MNAEIAPTAFREEAVCSLVYAAQQGNRNAFGRLFERYREAVYATVYRRLDNHADAEEICQDVFVQAMEKINQLSDPRRFGGWLLSTANHMSINRAVRNRKKRETDWSNDFRSICAEQATPQDTMLAQERQTQAQKALGCLNSLYRETLVAIYIDGRSLREISDQLGTPEGTIKRRAHVGREHLTKELALMAFA